MTIGLIKISISFQEDPKLLGDSGEVPIFEWSGRRFNSRYGIFSLLEERFFLKKKLQKTR
jgi:hypothetical protein